MDEQAGLWRGGDMLKMLGLFSGDDGDRRRL
jgi:hypothetical protein